MRNTERGREAGKRHNHFNSSWLHDLLILASILILGAARVQAVNSFCKYNRRRGWGSHNSGSEALGDTP
eukprot:530784-Amorphochlora_amoeboformis.AAC.1